MVLCLVTTGHKQDELYMTNPRVPNTSYIPSARIGVRVGSTGLRVGSARLFGYQEQCAILKVHSAPGGHILVAGCTGFRTCAPGRCMLFPNSQYNYNYI